MAFFSGTITAPEPGYYLDEWSVLSVEIASGSQLVGALVNPNIDGEYSISTVSELDRLVTIMLHQPFGDLWQAGESVSIGDYRRPSTFNGYAYRCITAGDTGGSEPSWNSTHAANTNDGTALWVAVKYLGVDAGKGKFVQGPYFVAGVPPGYTPDPNITWQGEGVYTPPAAGSVNINWL